MSVGTPPASPQWKTAPASPQCMTASVDRRNSTTNNLEELREVKIDSRNEQSAMAVLNRVNAMFAQSAASEARLVRMAHHSLDQVKGLLSRVQQEVGSVKLSRMRARQDPRIVDKFNPVKQNWFKPSTGESTLEPPMGYRTEPAAFVNKRPLSQPLAQMALGQRCNTPVSRRRRKSSSASKKRLDSLSFCEEQRLTWEKINTNEWRPSTPSVVASLKMDPTGPMCLSSQLGRFKECDRDNELQLAESLHHQTNDLRTAEPEMVGRPLVQNREKYRKVVNDMMHYSVDELRPPRPKTSDTGSQSKMRLGIIKLNDKSKRIRDGDCNDTVVKVHNAWICRFNSIPKVQPMR